MGTQATILLGEYAKNGIPQLIKKLEPHFLEVKHYQADYVIICKANKELTKRQVQDMCTGYTEIIENIHVTPCENIPDDQLQNDMGFVRGDQYRG